MGRKLGSDCAGVQVTTMTVMAIVVLFACLTPTAADYRHVVELNDSNFDIEVRTAGFVFVVCVFFSPSCLPFTITTHSPTHSPILLSVYEGTSHSFYVPHHFPDPQEFHGGTHNPELDDAARLLKDFSVASINVKAHPSVADKYHIKSIPMYKLFR
jgi:hypothetical protein